MLSAPFVNLKSEVIDISPEPATELMESGIRVPVIPFSSKSINLMSATVSLVSSVSLPASLVLILSAASLATLCSVYQPNTKCSLLSAGNVTFVRLGFSSKYESVVALTLRFTLKFVLSITA